jgi:hypothetical protein
MEKIQMFIRIKKPNIEFGTWWTLDNELIPGQPVQWMTVVEKEMPPEKYKIRSSVSSKNEYCKPVANDV